MAKNGINLTVDKLDEFIENVESMASQDVLVGIPEIETERSDDDDTMITNASLAYIHEHGAPEANIPARPFLIPGVEEVADKAGRMFKKAGEFHLDGMPRSANSVLHAIGLMAQSSVKNKIFNGPFEPLKESTLRARKNRKIAPRLGTRPLIDTSQMLNAVSYVIRDGNESTS